MPSNSCSLTNGPSLRPLPGTITLVSTIKARLTRRSGGKDTSHSVGRAVNSAARSADSTAHVFGTASVSTKKTMTLRTKPTATPLAPKSLSASNVVRNAWPICSTVTVTSSGLMKRSGWVTSRSNARADLVPRESAMAWALTREMRLSDVSATARNASTRRMAKIASSIQISALLIVTPVPGGRRPAPDRPSGGR